jgi:hypothetical protein
MFAFFSVDAILDVTQMDVSYKNNKIDFSLII